MEKIKHSFCFMIIVYLCHFTNCQGQEIISDDINYFVPASAIQTETQIFKGDLNRDNFEDIILRFKMKDEPDYQEHFYLLTGQKDGKYKLSAKNDSFELDNVDGTVFDKIVIQNGYFSLEYIGYGNTSGSYHIITFKYSDSDKNWLLHRDGSKLVHRYSEVDPIESIRTQNDFGKILFKDYGIRWN